MTLRRAISVFISLPLLVRRYLLRRPVVGSIPFEMRLHERYWEKRLRADTAGWAPVSLNDAVVYEGTPYLLLFAILRELELDSRDKLVDLGCGKGRAVAMAALGKAGCVIGVEQDGALLEVARQNIARLPATDTTVELTHGLAQQFNFDDTTVVFMFNPFGERTLREVAEMLRQSLQRNPRRLRIVYANPVHERVLHDAGWLVNTSTWPSSAYPEHVFQPPNPRMVSFWETGPERIEV